MRTTKANDTRYFLWLCKFGNLGDDAKNRRKVLEKLYSMPFVWTNTSDENRAQDGVYLRTRYKYDTGKEAIGGPCRVLEMMVAIAERIEVHFMDDNEENRIGKWFWEMIQAMGLYSQTDKVYHDDTVNDIVMRMMNREYERDGHGGLFVTKSGADQRKVDIWYQMCEHINSMLNL